MKYVYILGLSMLAFVSHAQDTIPRYREIFIRKGMLTDTTLCTQDGKPDFILFQPPTYAFQTSLVITDTNDIVQAVHVSSTYNFEGTGAGINRVYGIIYIGLLNVKPGMPLDSIEVNSYLIGITENYVTVNKVVAEGGTISDASGDTEVTLCLGDAFPDRVIVRNQGDPQYEYAYLVTDEDNKILKTTTSDTVSFDDATPGTCRIHGISYTGVFSVDTGGYLEDLSFGDRCFDLSSNYITVHRIPYSEVELPVLIADTNYLLVCSGDQIPDSIRVSSQSGGFPNSMFVVTDTNGVLLDYNESGLFDLEGGASGTVWIQSVGYFGKWTGMAGQDLGSGNWASACFAISENHIEVDRENVSVSTVSTDLGDSLSYCAGDGSGDLIVLNNSTTNNGDYVYLVTDTSGIVHQVLRGDSLDLETITGIQPYRIYGLSYSGMLMVSPDTTNVFAGMLAAGCSILSDNSIQVEQTIVDGGMLTASSSQICLTPDVASVNWTVQTSSASYQSYWFLVTDTSQVIQFANQTGQFNFNKSNVGDYRVYGVATASSLDFAPGDTLNLNAIPGCSGGATNVLSLRIDAFDAGSLTNTGGDGVVLCTGDDLPDTLYISVNGQGEGYHYSYLVTGTNRVIQAISYDLFIDWDMIPAGTSQIWGIHYDGNLPFEVGDTLSAGSCYALTASPINVQKVQVVSLDITSNAGDTLYFCANAVNLDSVRFETKALTSLKQAWFLVDSSNVVIQLTDQDRFTFDTSGNVQLAVYGATYTGNLIIQQGDTLESTPVSDACFALSANFIPIYTGDPNLVDGAIISSDLGDTLRICVSDGVEDFVTLMNQSSAQSPYSYVITDGQGKILAITQDTVVNFEGAGAGSGFIYGLSHANPLPNLLGKNILDPLAIGCYDLSQNQLVLIRSSVQPFTIASGSGDTLSLCVSPDSKDTIQIDFSAAGAQQALLVASLDGVILDYFLGNRIPVADLQVATGLIWGLSYGGSLNVHRGDTLNTAQLSDLCYFRSDNFLQLSGTYVSGDSIFVPSLADTVSFCVGNSIYDSLRLTTNSLGDHYVYLLLRANNRIEHIIKTPTYNLDPLESGTLTVVGLSYAGDLLIDDADQFSDTLTLATGCYSLSENRITVILNELLPGMITSDHATSSFAVCIGDGNPDLVTFDIVNGDMDKMAFLITDAQDEVVFVSTEPVIDLDVLPLGFYMVYGVQYDGELLNLVGQPAFQVPLSDGCFTLTDNGIEIIADQPDGGMVVALGGDSLYQFCVSDGIPDRLFLSNESNSLAPYQYIVTDSLDVIVEIPSIPGVDFEGSGAGVLRIWGLSYTGDLLIREGDTLTQIELSTDCNSLSGNYLTVIKSDGGPECGQPAAAPAGALQLHLAPNPVVNRMRLNISDWNGSDHGKSGTLIVYNTMQTEVLRKQVLVNNENFSMDVDVSNLKAGIYILQFNVGTITKSVKFIKQ
ncbi:MAG: T9SS type A sorting domain-containing protein [Saprospiraceae bacterium]